MACEGSFQFGERLHDAAVLGSEAFRSRRARECEDAWRATVEMQFAGFLAGVHQNVVAHAKIQIAANNHDRIFGIERLSGRVVEYTRHTQCGEALIFGTQCTGDTAEDHRFAV